MRAMEHTPTARTDRRRKVSRRIVVVAIAATLALVPAIAGADAAAPLSRTHGFGAASQKHVVTRRTITSLRTQIAKAPARARVAQPLPLLSVKGLNKPAKPAQPRARSTAPRIASVTPDAVSTGAFEGLAENDQGGIEPPDPWIAVNASYVVQPVNINIRISTRSGAPVSTFPSWLLFALPTEQFPSDARILWDAVHGRWVASTLSFLDDGNPADLYQDNYLNLAISETADPLGAWSVYALSYGDKLPDYPGLASSSDKIALTSNQFETVGLTFEQANVDIIDWAPLLGGTTPTDVRYPGPVINARPAQLLSSTADLYFVFEGTSSGAEADQQVQRFSGPAAGNGWADFVDLSLDPILGPTFPPFAAAPAPRQPGGTIARAFDERPTDAIWQNGHLWWVSTYPITYDGGSTFNAGVVAWGIDFTAAGTSGAGNDVVVSPADGIDAYMGGIGLTRDGTLLVVYTRSSTSDYVSLEANRFDGVSLGTPVTIASSETDYLGPAGRWGDYVGVATDPVGTGAVWQAGEYVGDDGTWATRVSRLLVDGGLPTTPGIPTPSIVVPATLAPTVSVKLTWTAATDAGSGTVAYQLAQQLGSAGFEAASTTSGLSLVRPIATAPKVSYRVRAVDPVGNAGAWATESYQFAPTVYQQTSGTVYTGSWSTSSSSSYSGGSVRSASIAGRYATFTASGARSIAIVTTKASSRGSFKVYVDNVYKGTISTYSTTTKYRQLVYQYSWPTAGTHKVKIYVVGTSGHPRVDVDAFVVLK